MVTPSLIHELLELVPPPSRDRASALLLELVDRVLFDRAHPLHSDAKIMEPETPAYSPPGSSSLV